MTGDKTKPLNLYGPEGLREWIRTTLKSSYGRVPSKYRVHEMKLGEVLN
jgi:ribonuclease Z